MNDLGEDLRAHSYPALRPIATQPIPFVDLDVETIPVRLATSPARLDTLEAVLLSQINGIRSIADLAVVVELSTRETLHILAGMVTDGTIKMTARKTRKSTLPPPPPGPEAGFVDFADVFEELGIEPNAPGAQTPTRSLAAPKIPSETDACTADSLSSQS
jgi:hypothetical protein